MAPLVLHPIDMRMAHRDHPSRNVAGFTLLEILVAIAIFVVVGVMAMGGYNELSRQSSKLEERMARVRAVQSAVFKLTQDFEQLEPRPIQQSLGSQIDPALRADHRNQDVAEFSRAGWSNPAGIQRPTLERVTYRLVEKKLLRDRWPVMDRTLANEPLTTELLDHVVSVKLRFMDASHTWQEQWPGANTAATGSARALPIAVEITLELEDWGTIVRLVEVAG